MHTSSPASERYRYEVQTRVQNLLAGRRPQGPKLSKLSTAPLLFEAVIEEVRICRLRKEERVRSAEGREYQRDMAAAALHAMYGKPSRRRRNRWHDRHSEENWNSDQFHSQRTSEVDDQGANTTIKISRGKSTSEDSEPRCMIPGGVGPLGTTVPSSRSNAQNSDHSTTYGRRGSETRKKHRQRYDSREKPLVQGGRGWRDACVGPPPKYKFKLDSTLGVGSHIKNCIMWGQEEYVLKQRKIIRRARGSLRERRDAWRKSRAGEKEKEKVGRERMLSGPSVRHQGQRESRGVDRQDDTDFERRGSAESYRSPVRSYTIRRVRAGEKARSRGERLAAKEGHAREASHSHSTPSLDIHSQSARLSRGGRDRDSLPRGKYNGRHSPSSSVAPPKTKSPIKEVRFDGYCGHGGF